MREHPEIRCALARHEARRRFRPARRLLVAGGFLVLADLAASGAPHVAEIVGTIANRMAERSGSVAEVSAPQAKLTRAEPAKLRTGTGPTQADDVGELSFDSKAVDPLPPPPYSSEQRACLARAVYFEARGEPIEGQIAVAQVVLNRVAADAWPKTICGVVYQGAERGEKCQFSFACTDNRRSLEGASGWEQSKWIADDVAAGRARLSELDGVLHYHAKSVRPIWRLSMRPVRTIGHHVFYLDRMGGAPSTEIALPSKPRSAPGVADRIGDQRRAAASEAAARRVVRSVARQGDFVSDTMDRMRQGAN